MRKMFTKRHHEAIAATMKAERPGLFWDANKRTQWNMDVKALALMFDRDNLAFISSKFIEACGGLFDV